MNESWHGFCKKQEQRKLILEAGFKEEEVEKVYEAMKSINPYWTFEEKLQAVVNVVRSFEEQLPIHFGLGD